MPVPLHRRRLLSRGATIRRRCWRGSVRPAQPAAPCCPTRSGACARRLARRDVGGGARPCGRGRVQPCRRPAADAIAGRRGTADRRRADIRRHLRRLHRRTAGRWRPGRRRARRGPCCQPRYVLTALATGGSDPNPMQPKEKPMPDVEIYTQPWCPYCARAINFEEQRRRVSRDRCAGRDACPRGGARALGRSDERSADFHRRQAHRRFGRPRCSGPGRQTRSAADQARLIFTLFHAIYWHSLALSATMLPNSHVSGTDGRIRTNDPLRPSL